MSLEPNIRTWPCEPRSFGGFFDPDAKRAELARIEEQCAKPDFWNDQERAQKVLRQRSRLETAIQKSDQFQRDVDDAAVLIEFAAEDEASLKELQAVLDRLGSEVEEAETEMLLSGPND